MENKKIIENKTFPEERALYGSRGLILRNCSFDGDLEGESALKECSDVTVENAFCNLRYPFWHNHGLKITDSELTPLCRAALWYSDHIEISGTKLHGIKALRECSDVIIDGCDVVSPEFGWSVSGIKMTDSTVESEYFMMRFDNFFFSNVHFKGKYSFQYIKNATFDNCVFDTKDAFWHAENVTVKNSIIGGEYLSWYSDGLTLINCKLIGTQPLCYCKNLKLVNCEMEKADFCFEKSEVDATVTTPVISIKNPASGTISVPSVDCIIMDDENAKGKIIQTKKTVQ